MKKLVLLALLALVVACGGSSAQIKSARDARYTASPATLFNEVKTAVTKNYQIALEDPGNLSLTTRKNWHTPEGLLDTAPGDNAARLNEGSINLSFIVTLAQAGGAYRVIVEPIILRKDAISSAPESLKRENALVPGWVHGRIDTLEIAIHDQLKAYAAGGTAPAAAPPAAEPMPAAPPATEPPPAEGSGSATGPAPEATPPPAP